MTTINSPDMVRSELLKELTLDDMRDKGYVRIYEALSYRLLAHFDQRYLANAILRELDKAGICPGCLREMKTRRRADGAGSMEDEFYCPECPGHI